MTRKIKKRMQRILIGAACFAAAILRKIWRRACPGTYCLPHSWFPM